MSASPNKDFWLSCGHHLLDREDGGGLLVTNEFLKVYLARPELVPPPEACAAEKKLYSELLVSPRVPVPASAIASINDPDARENWQLMVAFRDHLVKHRTLEAAYADLVRRGLSFPHLFINQLVHVILRNALDDCNDPFMLRAAEMMFRPQRMTLHEGSLLAADDETIAGTSGTPVSPLVSMLGLPPAAAIDVLSESNSGTYWERSDKFDFALDLTAGRDGLKALGLVLERWIGHVLSVETDIKPLVEMQDVNLTWYVGLDAEGTRIGDLIWKGEEIDDASRARVIGLYKLGFHDPHVMMDRLKNEPIYLVMAMTADNVLRIKPQNLVTGLPIKHLEAVT